MTAVLAPLRHAGFRWLAAGRTATYFANAMAPVALAFAVLDLTGSLVDLGLVVGARSVANVAVLLFAGVLADRLPEAVVLRGCSLVAALVQAAVVLGMVAGVASVPVFVLLAVANGAVAAVCLPAASALIPRTVPAGEVRQANAVSRMGLNIGMVAGSSAGGVLVAFGGARWGIACNAGAYLLAGLSYFGVRVAEAPRVAERARPLAELRAGWSEFTSRTWVWVVVAQFAVVNAAVAGGVQVLGPAVADATIGRTAWGLVLATQTFGALVGGLAAARWQPRHALAVGVAAASLDALPLLTLAVAPRVVPLVVAGFVNGVAVEQFGVAWDVALQQNVPADRLARVYSYDALGSFLALPVGEMAAGPAAERFGSGPVLVAAAGLVLVATAAALGTRGVRRVVTGVPAEPAPTVA